jgi:HSP20 family molecular chaperone IbpA
VPCAIPSGRRRDKFRPQRRPFSTFNVQILSDNVLEISGTSKSNGERSENQFHIRELSDGSFKRQLRLPENLEGEPVAELKDGILTLTFKLQLPEEKQPESRKIPIQKG